MSSPSNDNRPDVPGTRLHLAWPLWQVLLVVVPMVSAGIVLTIALVILVGRGSGDGDVVADARSTTTSTSTTASAVPAEPPTTASTTTTRVDAPSPPPTPVPTAPEPTAPTWDQIKNARIPGLCTHPPTTLVEGRDVTLSEQDGRFELTPILPTGAGMITDLPGPRGPITAVVASCNAGGVGWPNMIMLFGPGGEYYGSNDLSEGVPWEGSGMLAPGRDGVTRLERKGDQLAVLTLALVDGDAECCPSMDAYLLFAVGDHGLVSKLVAMDVGD